MNAIGEWCMCMICTVYFVLHLDWVLATWEVLSWKLEPEHDVTSHKRLNET